MTFDQAKIFCAESIIRNIVVLVENYGAGIEEIKHIDKVIKERILPYMKLKYAMTESNDISKALEKGIREIDNSEVIYNDFFYNTDIVF